MANLVDQYYNTNNRMFRFIAIPVQNNQSQYMISVNKWSTLEDNYQFNYYLSCQTYVELMDNPMMKIEEAFLFFDEELVPEKNNSLMDLISNNNIQIVNRDIHMTGYLKFPNIEEANKCIRLLQKTFIGITK